MKAPGHPGQPHVWTSGAKDFVTTSLGPGRVWATIGQGILNEVYWPSTGQPQVKDLGFIVSRPGAWFVEVTVNANYRVTTPAPTIPLPRIEHIGECFRLELEFLPDPLRDVLLVRYHLEDREEAQAGLKLYLILAPRLGPNGANTAETRGEGLTARGGAANLCLLSDHGFTRRNAGFLGYSDTWKDFTDHCRMTWTYKRAVCGNVALGAELKSNEGVLALAFAEHVVGAETLASTSLLEGYDAARTLFQDQWSRWAKGLRLPKPPKSYPSAVRENITNTAELSATVLKIHEDRTYPGAIVASLAIPWGNVCLETEVYHLVWPRDVVEAAFGLLAAGQIEDTRQVLNYLIATQSPKGRWSQNQFPDGRWYWKKLQLDEVGFPILLAAKLKEMNELKAQTQAKKMAGQAARFLVRKGPESPQDHWEENRGISPFTLGIEIAALVAAATYFLGGSEQAYVLELADSWCELIEEWTYTEDSQFTNSNISSGHYIRIAAPFDKGGLSGTIRIKNRIDLTMRAVDVVGMDYLYLVRLGLRSPNDHHILETVKVTEKILRTQTPSGVSYRRYNEDGYGEDASGMPWTGIGTGRPWPLLTAERGHLAAQQGIGVRPWLEYMMKMTGHGGLIPEQIWDGDPKPPLLKPGKPTGGAMPLVWAHAEFLKLLRVATSKTPIEMLGCVRQRYQGTTSGGGCLHWRPKGRFKRLPPGRSLLIELKKPFQLHFSTDGWTTVKDRSSTPLPFDMHGVRFNASELEGMKLLSFTFKYPEKPYPFNWERKDYEIILC